MANSNIVLRGVALLATEVIVVVGVVCESGVVNRKLGTAAAGLTRVHRCNEGAGLVAEGLGGRR